MVDRESLKPGNHIYVWRAAYSFAHHGIYVGNNKVIHFTAGGEEVPSGPSIPALKELSSGPSMSVLKSWSRPHTLCSTCRNEPKQPHGVMSNCFDCFLKGGELCRYDYGVKRVQFTVTRSGTSSMLLSDSVDRVLHRARYMLSHGFRQYHLLHNNCEDFCVYCKTGMLPKPGVGGSGQATGFRVTVLQVLGLVEGSNDGQSDSEESNMYRVEVEDLVISEDVFAKAGMSLHAGTSGGT